MTATRRGTSPAPLGFNRQSTRVAILKARRRIEALKGGWRQRINPPLVALLLALSTLFLFAADRGHFYRIGHHDNVSAEALTLAESLSPEHDFAPFQALALDEDGNPAPTRLYHRFPLGGFALIKLATIPFGDDLSAKILAARMLMLAFFSAAAVLAYLALARITGSPWIACAATALAFSIRRCLYYSDMISVEVSLDLFSVMLVFHALTIYVQENRFRQLVVKVCVALLLGWHVYALLLPFIALSVAIEMYRAYGQLRHAPLLARMRRLAGVLVLGRPTALGAVALAFGSLVLGLQLINEWTALGNAAPSDDLSTLESILGRTGIDPSVLPYPSQRFAWPIILEHQLHALGNGIFPFALPGYAGPLQLDGYPSAEAAFADMPYIGVFALAICIVGLCFVRQRLLLATLTSFGFFWSLPMRHTTAFHDYEMVFHVGVPMTLFSLALLHMRRLSGEPLMARLAIVALLTFVFSSWRMSLVGGERQKDYDDLQKEIVADFQAIRSLTHGGVIGIMSKETDVTLRAGYVYKPLLYYLNSRVLVPERHPLEFSLRQQKLDAVDFLFSDRRDSIAKTLTPRNKRFFLYEKDAYVDPFDTLSGDLAVQSNFHVYSRGDTLTYFKSPCTKADTAPTFLLHVYPESSADLPEDQRWRGYHNLDFAFRGRGVHFAVDSRRCWTSDCARRTSTNSSLGCTAEIRLPTYAKAQVRTGQFTGQGQTLSTIWSATFPLRKPPHPARPEGSDGS